MGQGTGLVIKDVLDAFDVPAALVGPEPPLIFKGTKFILPENMTLDGAVKFLAAKQDEEQGVKMQRAFDVRPWDGAAATTRVLERDFGGYAQQALFDDWGNRIPASKIALPISLTESVTVPWEGKIAVAMLPECMFQMGHAHSEKGGDFALTCEAPPRMEAEVNRVFDAVQRELEARSIYRGQAFDGGEMPSFLDLSMVDPSKVVYSSEVMAQLNANVWSIIRYPEVMEEHGVPLKRAVLFEGPYGTGKTLAAYLTAKEAVEHGWTFVYARPGRDNIHEALETARLYEPCVVFFEDIDTIAEAGDKMAMTKLLDSFDGIQNKGTRILAIVTTNHVGQIHKGMLRPGRLDAVISIGALDRPGVEKLVTATVASDKIGELDFDRLHEAADGMMPAFVREAIESAKRYAIARNDGELDALTTEDFEHAMIGMRPQLALMEGAADERVRPSLDAVHAAVMREVLQDNLTPWLKPIYDDYDIDDRARPEQARNRR